MTILFEPYSASVTYDTVAGTPPIRLPFGAVGTDVEAIGRVTMPFAVAATGFSGRVDGVGSAALTLPIGVRGLTADAVGLVTLPFGTSGYNSAVVAPSIGIGSAGLPFDVSGSGFGTNGGGGGATLPLRVFGVDVDAYGVLRMPLAVYAKDDASTRTMTLYQFPWVEALGHQGMVLLRGDAMAFGGAGDLQQVMVRLARLTLQVSDAGTLLDALSAFRETLTFDEVAAVVWQLLHTETLTLEADGVLASGILVQMAEALALSAGQGSQLDALSVVLASLRFGALSGYVWPASVLETLGLLGTPTATLLALNRRNETLSLGVDAVGYASFAMLAPETLALGGTGATTAELLNQIAEGATFAVRLSLPDGEYLAWVCHTESRAFTTYRNFPFNSFCELGGRYYGATDTGLYELAGDNDAGTPIAARVRTGLDDMGTGRLKRAEALYLGYRASGELVLKVVTTGQQGEKGESWYRLEPRAGADMTPNRVKVGKGLKSLYWGFELANVDGADFELDKISFLPMVLERKI